MDSDEIVRFYGGPKDGEAVKFPPDFVELPVDEVEGAVLPHYIEIKSGKYEFVPDARRYEWRG